MMDGRRPELGEMAGVPDAYRRAYSRGRATARADIAAGTPWRRIITPRSVDCELDPATGLCLKAEFAYIDDEALGFVRGSNDEVERAVARGECALLFHKVMTHAQVQERFEREGGLSLVGNAPLIAAGCLLEAPLLKAHDLWGRPSFTLSLVDTKTHGRTELGTVDEATRVIVDHHGTTLLVAGLWGAEFVTYDLPSGRQLHRFIQRPFGQHESSDKRKSAEPPDEMALMAKRFAALGDPARLRIVAHLMSTHPEGTFQREIDSELGMSWSELESHLAVLASVGLVESFQDGKTTKTHYRGAIEAVRGSMRYVWTHMHDGVIVR